MAVPAAEETVAEEGPRLTPRNIKAAETREKIVTAAAAAFDSRGYLGVNLKEVVGELGLTSGALYYFFKGKEDLAQEIVDRYYASWEPMFKEVTAAHADRLEALVAVSYAVGDAFEENVLVRAGARLSAERALIDVVLHPPYTEWRDRLTKLVRAGQRAGEINKDVQPASVADVVVTFFAGSEHIAWVAGERKQVRKKLERFWALTLPTMRP